MSESVQLQQEIRTSYRKAPGTKKQPRRRGMTVLVGVDETKRPYFYWTPEEEAELERLVKEGVSHRKIGEILGRSRDSVISKLRTLRQTGSPRPQNHAAVEIPRPLPEDQMTQMLLNARFKVPEEPAGETEVGLSTEQMAQMLYHAIGEELQAGREALLVDMLAALGFAVLKHFTGEGQSA